MNGLTRVFLVLLRIAIGWHFLVEGIDKVESVYLGPTETSKPWTSEVYLRESTGPLAPHFRGLAGDPDEMALARLEVEEPTREPPQERVPQITSDEWETYFTRFVDHYAIQGEQLGEAQCVFENHKNDLGKWLISGTKEVQKTFPSGSATVSQTTAQRVKEYRGKVNQVRDALLKKLPAFKEDVLKQKLTALKGNVRRMRSELLADLNARTNDMKESLQEVLTTGQKGMDPLPDPAPRNPKLELVDWLTRWGLLVVGALLILGLFSRSACVGGATLLLMFYLAMPPFPGMPDNVRAEGHYFIINKNIIEMLALLVLATTRSGRWLGLDALLQFLNPFRKSDNGTEQANSTTSSTSPKR